MKVIRIAFSILLVTMLALPAMASSDWVDEFLRRYEPSRSLATVATTSMSNLGQLLRTGEVPVTINDVISMMIDNNLDIRSNRLSPRKA